MPDDGDVVLRPADLRFRYQDAYPDAPIPESYERLLQDAMAGDAHLFMRSDEIERAWEIMDPFIAAVERRREDAGVPGRFGRAVLRRRLAGAEGRAWLPLCGH